MFDGQGFAVEHTRGELLRNCAQDPLTSEGLGWDVLFASRQREQPFEATLTPISAGLLILHRSGPVPVMVKGSRAGAVTQLRRRGQVSFIPGNCSGQVNLRAPHDTLHVYLRSDLFGTRASEPRALLGVEDAMLDRLGAAVAGVLAEHRPGTLLCVDPIARAMATRVLWLSGQTPKPCTSGRLSDRQLSRVSEYIDANLDSEISIAELASACGMAASRLRPFFRASTGMTPYRYVIARRIARAKDLLANPSMSLPEIALRCGFCHQEHMTRVFREATGLPPGRFRACL